jgi:hypothetical protein
MRPCAVADCVTLICHANIRFESVKHSRIEAIEPRCCYEWFLGLKLCNPVFREFDVVANWHFLDFFWCKISSEAIRQVIDELIISCPNFARRDNIIVAIIGKPVSNSFYKSLRIVIMTGNVLSCNVRYNLLIMLSFCFEY